MAYSFEQTTGDKNNADFTLDYMRECLGGKNVNILYKLTKSYVRGRVKGVYKAETPGKFDVEIVTNYGELLSDADELMTANGIELPSRDAIEALGELRRIEEERLNEIEKERRENEAVDAIDVDVAEGEEVFQYDGLEIVALDDDVALGEEVDGHFAKAFSTAGSPNNTKEPSLEFSAEDVKRALMSSTENAANIPMTQSSRNGA